LTGFHLSLDKSPSISSLDSAAVALVGIYADAAAFGSRSSFALLGQPS